MNGAGTRQRLPPLPLPPAHGAHGGHIPHSPHSAHGSPVTHSPQSPPWTPTTMSKAAFFRSRGASGHSKSKPSQSQSQSSSQPHPQSPPQSLSHSYLPSQSLSQSQSQSRPRLPKAPSPFPFGSPRATKPSTPPQQQRPLDATAPGGYTAPGAASVNVGGAHTMGGSSDNLSPIRTGGLGGGGTGGHAYALHHHNSSNNDMAYTPTSAAGTSSTSWGLASSPHSPTSSHTGLVSPSMAGPGPTSSSNAASTWNRAAQIAQQAHRPQQASADFDNMVASMGFNRFGMSPTSDRGHDSGGTTTLTHQRGPSRSAAGDIYVRMDSPGLHSEQGDMGMASANGHSPIPGHVNGEADFDSDSDFARAFSPPRYAGYATLPDDVPVSAVSATAAHDDRFTPLPTMRTRQQKTTSRMVDPRIGERALASPPPRERNPVAHTHTGAPTEESHDSALSGSSAMTGMTTDSSTYRRPQLSSSTSTAMTTVTTVTSPTMGSDEMLMALMASQAAVDCDRMPVGGWEEVESWKKELLLLSTRLDALQARHQREVRILTAARTLQKLNQSNKRLSKQTMESLEQSEKRVEKAEKEVLVLRNREASLRRRLMEHWAGVMAWEVRRLERTHSETQARLEMHVRAAENDRESLIERLASMNTGEQLAPKMVDNGELRALQDRERELQTRVNELENKLHSARVEKADLESERELTTSHVKSLESERERRAGRIAELEEMVLELGRRERALEEGAKEHDAKLVQLERERDDWHRERDEWERERAAHAQERDAWAAQHEQMGRAVGDRDAWDAERQMLIAERDALQAERAALEAKTREHGASRVAWVAERERLTADRDMLHQGRAELEAKHAQEREEWMSEREQLIAERELLEAATSAQAGSQEAWQRERETLLAKQDRMAADLEALAVEHDRLKEESRGMQIAAAERVALSAERDQLAAETEKLKNENARLQTSADRATSSARNTTERIGGILGAILGRKVATEGELVPALEEVRTLLDTQRSELQAIGERHQEELQILTADRDAWKTKAEETSHASRAAQTEMTELVRKIRTQNEQISDMNAQLAATRSSGGPGAAGAGPGDRIIETKLQRLWGILPSPRARADAGLNDPRVVSPNSAVNFSILQRAYAGNPKERYTNVDDLIARVQGLVDDGRLLVERMQRVEVEKDRHKANAVRAAQLVSDSRASLEKYQAQVQQLEEQISAMGSAGSDEQIAELEREISILQRELEQAHGENSRLRQDIEENRATIDMFSARTLTMADDHERETQTLKAQLKTATEQVEEERTRAQVQTAQVMGEMMDLQDEIAKLRSARR